MLAALRPTWHERDQPLPATAVFAPPAVAPALARSARSCLDDGRTLRAAFGHGHLLVLGETSDLPWAEGVTYLGWEATVLVPTTHEPRPATALIASAARRGAGPHDLVIVLPDLVLHTENPRPITHSAAFDRLIAT